MRRWLASLLVALLLMVQQGAVLHGLAHAMAAAAQESSVAGGLPSAEPAELPCGDCLAFAQLAGVHLPPQWQAGLLMDLAHAQAAHTGLAGLVADTPAARSRDPPAPA